MCMQSLVDWLSKYIFIFSRDKMIKHFFSEKTRISYSRVFHIFGTHNFQNKFHIAYVENSNLVDA